MLDTFFLFFEKKVFFNSVSFLSQHTKFTGAKMKLPQKHKQVKIKVAIYNLSYDTLCSDDAPPYRVAAKLFWLKTQLPIGTPWGALRGCSRFGDRWQHMHPLDRDNRVAHT